MQKRLGIVLMTVAAALTAAGGCQSSHLSSTGDASLKARVRANDASAARQLATGFYGVESNSWRWTARKFSVILPLSDEVRKGGATVNMALFFPAGEMTQLGSITLSADANGTALPPQTFTKSGDAAYSRDVPASALTGATVRMNFVLDKAMPPSGQDVRELGAVFHQISLKTE